MAEAGQIVVLNGAPRSGKSSIVAEIQRRAERPWMNLGVDVFAEAIPERYRPGVGLRPGGERHDLDEVVPILFAAMYESIAAHSRLGLDVVVDVGHHDGYRQPRRILLDVARRLAGLPAYLIGVPCPVEVIMQRRDAGHPGREGRYVTSDADGGIPEVVQRWQHEVHTPGVYDLEVDTSVMSPVECAEEIGVRLAAGSPTAFAELLARASEE